MMQWLSRWRGWIILVVLAAAFYPHFGKSTDGAAFYAESGRCILRAVALLPCLPSFPYQPALAALLIPLSFVPAALQRPVWYVICVGSLVVTVRVAEAIAELLYPGATRGQNLTWLRVISLVACAKHILDVLIYAAYDAPALAMMTLGIWALCIGRNGVGGLWLGLTAAIRATPIIYLPYLLLKRRYLACLAFTAAFIAVTLLPEIFGALRGGHVGYFNDWLRQVVEPTIVPGNSPKLAFWDTWNGANLYNQSLRGLVNRLAHGPLFGLSPLTILIAADGAFALVLGVLLLSSPRDKEYAAIDGAMLLIAILVLSPMTSRYHYIFVLPAVILVGAATIADRRIHVLGCVVLGVSFLLRAGTSNDLAGQTVTDFAYMYGFMPAGAMVLYVAFAAMLWVWRPPGIPAREGKTLEPALANRVETQAEDAAIIPVAQTNAPR
jgi:hypothetical protein